MKKILALGTVALDTVETPFGKREGLLGGSAAHFALSCRFFAEVNLVAVVGEDFPVKYINFLRQKGVGLNSLLCARGKTFHWQGKYRGDLNAAITLKTELGVLADFQPQISPEEKKIKYLFLANVDPDKQMALLEQMQAPKLVALDSMNYWIRHKRQSLLKVLKKVYIYLANDQEARDLSGEDNLIKAAQRLRRLGPQMILIKKGEHGSLFYSDKFIISFPAYPQERVIDPTGAGDTFAGGFMGYLVREEKISAENIKRALAYGTVAASFNVEDFGVNRSAKITIRDLRNRLNRFRKITSFGMGLGGRIC